MPETDQKFPLPKLKPCPCGAPAELQRRSCSQFPDGFVVACSRSCEFGSFQKFPFKFQQTAVDSWNLYIEHNF